MTRRSMPLPAEKQRNPFEVVRDRMANAVLGARERGIPLRDEQEPHPASRSATRSPRWHIPSYRTLLGERDVSAASNESRESPASSVRMIPQEGPYDRRQRV
jgi:hypothetical protein